MENLKKMKECLIGVAEGQIYGNLDQVNAKELGEVMDMIKDLSEAVYYCTITESMEKAVHEERGGHETMYYAPHSMETYDPRYRERYPSDMMYAQNGGARGGQSSGGSGSRGGSRASYTMYNDGSMYHRYPEEMYPIYRDGGMRDPREGRSGERRKMYMEDKGHKDKMQKMQELEAYMQELANDMTDMIQDASPEEKQLLQTKISTLAAKIK